MIDQLPVVLRKRGEPMIAFRYVSDALRVWGECIHISDIADEIHVSCGAWGQFVQICGLSYDAYDGKFEVKKTQLVVILTPKKKGAA